MARKKVGYTLMGAILGAAAAAALARAYVKARANTPPFRRRVYSDIEQLLRDLRFFWEHPEELRSIRTNPALPRPLIGRLMLAVTGVNGCRYCNYVHASYALRQGITREQTQRLLAGDLEDAPLEEAPALFYAQHYAETGGEPGSVETQRLIETYGSRTAHDLVALIRLITMGNLIGNTFDAFLSRLLGQPSPDSTWREELAVLLLSAFAVGPLLALIMVRSALHRG
ncbi:MAG: carboxymuconolactone decarboxylase family protein [Chloroflexi bacterium]|nr:carboxymuconolactone decarboxylase family protein [Chloroflexota bacterium]